MILYFYDRIQKIDRICHTSNFIPLKATDSPPSFVFDWPGKKEAAQLAKPTSLSPIHLPETPGKLLVGDNLTWLQYLVQEKYSFDAIYIDPPYNTGNRSFIYKDHFTQANRHVEWLNMMLPRLLLGRELLAQHGIIFISIDENELAHLKLLTDEVFGEDSFVDIFSWAKTETPANLSRKSKKVVEYVLCYQKEKDNTKFSGIRKFSPSSNGLLNQTNLEKELVFPAHVVETKLPDQYLEKGLYGTERYAVHLLEDTEVKNGRFCRAVKLRAKFKWGQQKLEEEIKAGTRILIPTKRLSPAYERQEYAAEVPPNLINMKVGVETNEMAKFQLEKLLGANLFDYPKPVTLLKYLLQFLANPNGHYLDFFAGSGTLAEAVLALNQEDGGSRSYCCVQLDEACNPKSIAYQKGFRHIAEITRFRIEKCLEKYGVPSEQFSVKEIPQNESDNDHS